MVVAVEDGADFGIGEGCGAQDFRDRGGAGQQWSGAADEVA